MDRSRPQTPMTTTAASPAKPRSSTSRAPAPAGPPVKTRLRRITTATLAIAAPAMVSEPSGVPTSPASARTEAIAPR